MSAQEAAPGLAGPGQRRIRSGNASESSAIKATFNSISAEPKTYDELQLDMRGRRPRLMDVAVDHALTLLIQRRAVQLSDDGRWWARG